MKGLVLMSKSKFSMKEWLKKFSLGQKLIFANFLMMMLPQILIFGFAGQNGMIACLVLWYIVYPLYSLVYGWQLGKGLEYQAKYLPLPALFYLPTALLMVSFTEAALYLYAGIYLAGSCFAALLHHLLKMYMK